GELGDTLGGFDPRAGGPSPLARFLSGLRTTCERAAAGALTREGIALARNEVFAHFCESRGDERTAALYRERIQPDERFHHELGRRLLQTYATTEEAQERARAAARETLRVADELQEMLRIKRGLSRLPGC